MQWPVPMFPTRHVYNPRAGGGTGFVGITSNNNSKGPWTTLVPGTTAYAASWAYLNGTSASSSSDSGTLMDIAIGEAGNESIVVENLMFGFRRQGDGMLFPLHVPAGATVRGRLSSARSGSITATAWSLDLYGGEPDAGLSVPGKITTYGAVPASSSGTAVTPNSSANVKGSWTQLTAATIAPINLIMVMAQGSTGTISGLPSYNIDIGVGSSGSETAFVHDYPVDFNPNEEMRRFGSDVQPLSLNIPAGVRLAARCSADESSAQAIEVAVYGFTF